VSGPGCGGVGISVPADPSLVGFDDSPAAAVATPPLTTVAQPHEKKGRLATERLLDAIEHRADSEERFMREILPTED
jgi:DNA-binding LacI/PurR family transcriptional regulator